MREIGVRDLRATLPTVLRRVAGGESTVVTVNGRVVAMVTPPSGAGTPPDLAALAASGAVIAPRRTDRELPASVVRVWGDVRLDRLLREIRG